MKIGVFSKSFRNPKEIEENLDFKYILRNKKIVIIGSGPAGFFAAFVLQKSGFQCTIIDRGLEVDKRAKAISNFEKNGVFYENANYSFGEGGAGTFSDGKLTARGKKHSREKLFILNSYVKAGAPDEIKYMKHPHLGSDNLRKIVKNLRSEFIEDGGKIIFDTKFLDFKYIKNNKIIVETNNGEFECDKLLLAIGHSATDTYKALINKGLPFRTKNFAIGSRAEHYQEVINKAQWGVKNLEGVKAAEYRLTAKYNEKQSVYSFCMCPGGIIVPAASFKNQNIVNGMSYFRRNGKFANAAIVAGISPNDLANKSLSPMQAIDELFKLEESFYKINENYIAPFCSIKDFINQKITRESTPTSYPFGVFPAPLWELLPANVVKALRSGLISFSNKVKNYEYGNLIGLESKTSSPIQILRNENAEVESFENIYMIGEGSGYSGGIMSSAIDGLKTALSILS
jgi:uncharacterized FAD-dependent dehydrogenase